MRVLGSTSCQKKKQRQDFDEDDRARQPARQNDDRGRHAPTSMATRDFLHGCFSRQPSADDHETMLAFNMMVLPKVRAGLGGRPLEHDPEKWTPIFRKDHAQSKA
jgi:hypothetical protein